MRTGFYIHHTMLKAGGIFTYSIGILRLLLKAEEINKIVIITTPEVKSALSELVNNNKIEFSLLDRESSFNKIRLYLSFFLYDTCIIYQHYFPKSKILTKLKRISNFINPYQRIVINSGIKSLHVPIQYSPIYKTSVPVITTMHDVQEFHFPEFFTASERLHRAINNLKSVSESDHIIVSFEHIKNDLLKYYSVPEEKLSVCPPPFADDWFATKKETDWQILEKKYSITKKYLLYPAATWPHKNHIRLLDALKEVQKRIPDINLICTGNKTDYYDIIYKNILKLGLENSVKFLGIVPEEDLIGLYKNAELVVIPTLYEAGSGPLYEAMRYGAPVICSNVTSLPESISNDEFTFNPDDYQRIAELILIGIIDEEFRKRNIENSKSRLEFFKQQEYLSNFLGAYNEAIKHKKRSTI
jgi:glycosyltransferase involved in cell wall biosynthesis